MRILFLSNRNTCLTKLNNERYWSCKVLSKHVEVKFWGLNWDGYNPNVTVQENIDTLPDKYDLAIAYKPLEMKKFKDINIPKVLRYNEMYDIKWTLKEIRESGAQLVICHHLNDCELYQRHAPAHLPDVKFVYVGHCADPTVFKNYNLPKEYDILLLGAISPRYPLRQKFLKLLPYLKQKYKCHHHLHPGYELKDSYTKRYLKEMAIVINKSRIALTDTGLPRTRYGKYVEIPMCGTSALCGDLPDDKADDYSYIIEVTNSMSLREIMDKISYYLDNEDKRLEKVQKGIEFAKKYTWEHYVERLLKVFREFLQVKNL